MKTYIGTKIIEAEPEKRGEETGFKVRYPDGYVSWSPAQPFEEAYQPTDAMSFGHAVEMLKRDERVTRAGWNGKGMYLALMPGGDTGTPDGRSYPARPYIVMKTADDQMVPWTASQSDVLADDWQLVGE